MNAPVVKWMMLLLALALFCLAASDLYRWYTIASADGWSMEMILHDYYKTFPSWITQGSRLKTMYLIRFGNICVLVVSLVLFFLLRPSFRNKNFSVALKAMMVLEVLIIFLQVFMLM